VDQKTRAPLMIAVRARHLPGKGHNKHSQERLP
jgi:hypothetical protein